MKKLIALLCAVCAAAMSLCVACASPLTGDTSNMGLWITLVVVAVIAVVVLLIVGKKKKNKQRADRPGPMARGGFYLFRLPFLSIHGILYLHISIKRKTLAKERTT